ncbi:hypothetical protein DL96DRAFT_1812962 [Flagelloscypha sp. PMI_526]|nr:hypothetical protein DL96DRAFT_1812962 [Flagelloscypha sp. PMI_526]
MVYLLRNSQKIPPHLRRLVYASTLLIFPTLAFCLLQFGFISFLITPVALLLTIIYHIVLIVRHNRRASRQSKHNELVWESTGALAGGYMICTVWTAGLGMTVFRIAWTIHVTTQFDYYPYFSTLHHFGSDLHFSFHLGLMGSSRSGYPYQAKGST